MPAHPIATGIAIAFAATLVLATAVALASALALVIGFTREPSYQRYMGEPAFTAPRTRWTLSESAPLLEELYALKLAPPHVGHVFAFEEAREAIRLFQSGRTTGKVVLKLP